MDGLLSSNDDNDQLLNDTISSLRKLCGENSINLQNKFWDKEMNSMAANLHHLGAKMKNVEEEMMTLCNNFVVNNIKTRNLNTLIQHITNLLRGILQNDKYHKNCSNDLSTPMNLLLLIRVFIKYFVEVSSLNELSLQFLTNNKHHNNTQIITEFYQTLITILNHFLPNLLHKTYLPNNNNSEKEDDEVKYSTKIEDLYLEITSLLLSVSSTQLFTNPELNEICIKDNSHLLLKQLLNLSNEYLTDLIHVLISIISFESNNIETHSHTPPISPRNNPLSIQELHLSTPETFASISIGLSELHSINQSAFLTETDIDMKSEASISPRHNNRDTTHQIRQSNFFMNIGRNIFNLVYGRWTSSFSDIDILNHSPLKEHSVLILLLLTHQNSELKNNFCNLIRQLHDTSIDITSPLLLLNNQSMERDIKNYLSLDISFEHLCQSLLKSLNDCVDDNNAFKINKYSCEGNLSFSTSLLLLYTLLQNNNTFKEYIFVYTEIDKLILPLLHHINHICYQQIDIQLSSLSHTIYIILIILLIFSSDSLFIQSCFTQIIYGDTDVRHPNFESKQRINWYRKVRITKINANNNKTSNSRRNSTYIKTKTEHIECPVSLGNMIFIVMVELFQNNVVNFRDKYIHENCLAILSNIAPFCVNLHGHCSKKLVYFTNVFIKKIHHKLSIFIQKTSDKNEQASTPIFNDAKFMEVLSLTSQLLSICRILISQYLMPGNKFVVYCLMQIEKNLNKCLKLCLSQQIVGIDHDNNNDENIVKFMSLIMNLGNELSAILQTVHYFHNEVANYAKKSGTALDIKIVLNIIEKYSFHWRNINDDNDNDNDECDKMEDAQFEYEENDNSVEFFLPFIWRLIYKHSGIHFLDDRIKIFKL